MIETLRNLPRPNNFSDIRDAQRYSEDLLGALERWQVETTDKDKTLEEVFVRPEWYGAKGDGVKDDTTALQAALTAAGGSKVVLLGAATYSVTATAGNYALTFTGPVVGLGPNISVIKNVGAGSAVKMGGTSSDMYYIPFSGFSVLGNASSQDGIVTNTTAGIPAETAYCNFINVTSHGHGRHGLVHRASWGTVYQNCQFYDNSGLGVYLYSASGDDGTHNAVSFFNCHARHNGGTGSVGADYLHGGVRIGGGYAVYWQGGAIEQNNAWGLMIGHNTDWTSRDIEIKNVYFEDNPHTGTSSTVGGNIRVDEKYEQVVVHDCWMQYGADLGATGYCFYIAHGPENEYYFKEYNNFTSDYGAGTNTRDYGLKFDWTSPIISQTLSAGTYTILNAQGSGEWSVNGFVHCKESTEAVGGVYPFIAAYGAASGLQSLMGYAIVGGAVTDPTIAWNGGALEVTIPASHTGHVELSLGGAEGNPSSAFSPAQGGVFVNDFVKRASPA